MPFQTPEIISEDTYQEIAASGKHGPMKHGYPAVIMHPDGTITKIWAKKTGFLSSSRLKPYSKRFISNANQLASHGVTVPKILSHQRIETSHVYLVRYEALDGTSVRELLESDPQAVDITAIARYIYNLHEKGIVFRAIHFGNIIQMPDQQYGLIDFTDVTFLKKPAPLIRRAANIATPLRYRHDVKNIKKAGLPNLRKRYLKILRKQGQDVDKASFKQMVKERTKKRS